MSTTWNPTPPATKMPQGARLMLHAVAPAFMVMTANALLMLGGGGADFPTFAGSPAEIPAWASATAWIVLLVMLGVARHEIQRRPDPQTFAIDALIVATMVYPFSANAFGAHWTVANTLTTLGIAAMALAAALPQSWRATLLLAAPTAWLGLSSWLAIAATA